MNFKTAIDELVTRTNTTEDTKRAYLRRKFNFSVGAYWRSYNWSSRYKTAQITLIPNVAATGTTTVFDGTNEGVSRSVSITTPSLTWLGRYLNIDDTSEWHRIVGVDVTNGKVTLESPVLTAGTSFTIWKKLYALSSDCDTLISLYSFNGEGELGFRPSPKMVGDYTNLSSASTPQKFGNHGIDNYQDLQYSTGLVSGVVNQESVVGVGTEFIENASIGDILIVGDYEYAIKRIETDLSLTLYTNIVDKITDSEFSIRKNNPKIISLYPNTDQYRILTYDYLAKPYSFTNEDYDILPFDDNEIECILKRAEAEVYSDKNLLENYNMALTVFDARLSGLKRTNRSVIPRAFQFEPLIDTNMPGRGN